MGVHICNHPDQPHTVMYWVEDGGPPIPMMRTFDNQDYAVAFANSGIIQAKEYTQLRWLKVFRTDNESYTCYRWENDLPHIKPMQIVQDAAIGVESTHRPNWWFYRGKHGKPRGR